MGEGNSPREVPHGPPCQLTGVGKGSEPLCKALFPLFSFPSFFLSVGACDLNSYHDDHNSNSNRKTLGEFGFLMQTVSVPSTMIYLDPLTALKSTSPVSCRCKTVRNGWQLQVGSFSSKVECLIDDHDLPAYSKIK